MIRAMRIDPSGRTRRATFLLAAAGLVLLAGCGDKITIPVAKGVFGVRSYQLEDAFDAPDATNLVVARGSLLVVDAVSLTKRNLNFEQLERVGGLARPTAVCVDDSVKYVFVWSQDSGEISWYGFQNLDLLGSQQLDDVAAGVVSMTTSRVAIEDAPGAYTFIYVSTGSGGRILRYAFDPVAGLTRWGILARSYGEAARFVNLPAGVTRDASGMVLACDRDTLRNWVIRFDPTPQYDDAPPAGTENGWRGLATVYRQPGPDDCEPPAPSFYALGNAPGCDPAGYVPGPGDAPGEFDAPLATAIDGRGRIYVADMGNDRFQIFDRDGTYVFRHGSPEDSPRPLAIGVVDQKYGSGDEEYFWGAEVYLLVDPAGDPASREVRRFWSTDYANWDNTGPPPPPQ